MRSLALLTTTPSDCHMWNIIYIGLWLQEKGFEVKQTGICVPIKETIREISYCRPEIVVVSTVNGHGYHEGGELIKRLKEDLMGNIPQCVIGGKLTVDDRDVTKVEKKLYGLGYNGVFQGACALSNFSKYLDEQYFSRTFHPALKNATV